MSTRTFAGLLAHAAVHLIEYQADDDGIRVIGEWWERQPSASIDDAADRLITLLSARGAVHPRLALALTDFGVFHLSLPLPTTHGDLVEPILQREAQRLFGIADPVVTFGRDEWPDDGDTDGPTQIFAAGAPRETVDALRARITPTDVHVDVVTVVPRAVQRLYDVGLADLAPTAVVTWLDDGAHLAFFLDGRLELAIDPPPPITAGDERPTIATVIDQVESGIARFRQQFAAAPAQFLLCASRQSFDALASALEERFGIPVMPLAAESSSPATTVAVGAVLEAEQPAPLDLFPHQPTRLERVRQLLRGPNFILAGIASAALIAVSWSAVQVVSAASARRDVERLRAEVRASLADIEPMRRAAEARADFVSQTTFVAATASERDALTSSLSEIVDDAPADVKLDSLQITRAPSAWSASLVGEASAPTAARAMGVVDAYYQSIRRRSDVVSPALDDFDVSAAAGSDRAANRNVVVRFRVSFGIPRSERR